MLVQKDTKTGGRNAVYVRKKGPDDNYVMNSSLNFIKELGWTKVIAHNDGEPSIIAVQKEMANRRSHPTIPRLAPIERKQSLGSGEGEDAVVQGQVRTMMYAFEKRYKKRVRPFVKSKSIKIKSEKNCF